MKKIFVILISLLLLCACFDKTKENTGSDLEYIKEKGTLIVGVTYFEPMDYQENDKWIGFDADLANVIGEKIGVEVIFQEISWATKETELASKTIDCIWNGLTYSDERAKNMSMSNCYMSNRQVIVVRKDDADKYTNIKDFTNLNIAAESDSAGEEIVLNEFINSNYIEKTVQLDALTELISKNCDAAVLDYIMAYYLLNKENSSFSELTVLDGIIETEDEYYAIAFRKDSDVTELINKYLKEMKEDGTIETIADKYGLKDVIVY